MFESLGYAGEGRAAARRLWSLPLAAGVQLAVAATYTLYSLFATEALQPPPTWISSLPAIPVTLVGGHRPTPQEIRPSRPDHPKQSGLADPGRQNIVPVDHQVTTSDQQFADDTLGDDGGVPGLEDFLGLGFDKAGPGAAPETASLILTTEQVVPPRLVRQVNPVYPRSALAMRMTGTVTLQAVVDEAGRVVEVQVLGSTNAIFDRAAMDAVRQWQYTRPISKAGGQAVACYMRVVVNFALG